MAENGETIMLRGIPPRLKGKIAKRVKERGTNMNDVLVEILSDEYRVEFEPTNARRLEIGKSPQVLLTVPAELKARLRIDAAERNDTIRNVAMEIICGDFGVPFQPTGRWSAARA